MSPKAPARPVVICLTQSGVCATAFPDKSGPTESVQIRLRTWPTKKFPTPNHANIRIKNKSPPTQPFTCVE